jgi:uncharacterized OB-fold protein
MTHSTQPSSPSSPTMTLQGSAIPSQMLTLLRCKSCNRLDSRQRVVCSGCLSASLQEQAVPGQGVLVTLTTIRRAPTAWRDRAPYRVVVVDLDAGARVTGRLAPECPEPELGARLCLLSVEGQDLVFISELISS